MANGPAVREMRVESRESRARRQIERVRRLRLEVEQKLKRVLVTEARYEEFRSAAIKFRNKASTTSAYVSRCIELLGGKHTTKQLLLDFMSLLFSKPVQEELFREVERQLANPKKRMPAQQSVNHKHERQRAEQQTHQKKLHTRTKNAGPSQRRSNEAPAIPPAAASRPVTEAADRSRSSKPAVHIALSRTQKKAMLQLVNDTLAEAKCLHASGRGLNSHEKKQIQNCAAKFQTKYQREKEPLHKLLVLLESHFPQHSNGRSNRGDAHANADSAKAAWQRVVAEQVVCIVHDKCRGLPRAQGCGYHAENLSLGSIAVNTICAYAAPRRWQID